MQNYDFKYIKDHFSQPGKGKCTTPLDYHKLLMYGAFDPEHTMSDLSGQFWKNINRLCTYDENANKKVDCRQSVQPSFMKYKKDGAWMTCGGETVEAAEAKVREATAVDLPLAQEELEKARERKNMCNEADIGNGTLLVQFNDTPHNCEKNIKEITFNPESNRIDSVVATTDSEKCKALANEYLDVYSGKDGKFMYHEEGRGGIPLKIPEPDFYKKWEEVFYKTQDNAGCHDIQATSINDYNMNMSNYYVSKVKQDYTNSTLSNINKTLYNDPTGNNKIVGKGGTWLDMNFLSCDREDYELLSVDEKVKAKYINNHPYKSGWYNAKVKDTSKNWVPTCKNTQEQCCGVGEVKPINEKTDKQLEDEIKKAEAAIADYTSKREGNLFSPGYVRWKDRWERNKGRIGDFQSNKQSTTPESFIPIPRYDIAVSRYVKTKKTSDKESEFIEVKLLPTDETMNAEGFVKQDIVFPDSFKMDDIDEHYIVKSTVGTWMIPFFQKENCINYPITGYIPTLSAAKGSQEINDNFVKNVNKLFKTISKYDKLIYETREKLKQLEEDRASNPKECKCESKKYRTNDVLKYDSDIVPRDKQGCNEMLNGLLYSIQFDNEGEIDMKTNDTPRWRTIDELKTGAAWYTNNQNSIDERVNGIDKESGLINNIIKNDSDLDNTNLLTGFSDKLFGCKTQFGKTDNSRKTYTMDWKRLKDNGKLKYGFKGEELHMKILALTNKIKEKKNISILFLTSFSAMLLYLIFKLKNKK